MTSIASSQPEHDVAFIKPEVSVDKMHSEFVLDVEAFDETRQFLKVNRLHVRLVSVVGEKIVTVSRRVSAQPFNHLAQTCANDDCLRSSMVGGT